MQRSNQKKKTTGLSYEDTNEIRNETNKTVESHQSPNGPSIPVSRASMYDTKQIVIFCVYKFSLIYILDSHKNNRLLLRTHAHQYILYHNSVTLWLIWIYILKEGNVCV